MNPGNRSFRYGDGLFETIRAFDGRLPFWNKHWQRLSEGMKVLRLMAPPAYSTSFFEQEIQKLTGGRGNWRIRLTVWRSGGGLYTPEQSEPEFLIEVKPLESGLFTWKEEGLCVGFFEEARLCSSPFSHLKTCNALPFVLAGVFKKENGLDDCLLFNSSGKIVCGSSSNIFLFKGKTLFTPPLSEGCIAGTMRSTVISLARRHGIKLEESPISRKQLVTAAEVFLTNAILGLSPVKRIIGANWIPGEGVSGILLDKLNEEIAAV